MALTYEVHRKAGSVSVYDSNDSRHSIELTESDLLHLIAAIQSDDNDD